jgi:hypothetical protein
VDRLDRVRLIHITPTRVVYAYCLPPGLRYIILTLVQTLYAYFIEGDIIFVGKRKTFDKRVRTTFPRGVVVRSFIDYDDRSSQNG